MSIATDMRDAYLAAELAVLKGQSVDVAGRRLTFADLAQIVSARKEWEARVAAEQRAAAGQSSLGVSYADFSGCPR